jgi:GNAT superfamily N-acetyltransferase
MVKNKNSKVKTQKKVYRKKSKTYKLRGGTFLRQKLNHKSQILHPLNFLVQKKVGDYYLIQLDKNNVDKLDYQEIFSRAFFQKFTDILNVSFEKEREYAIERGYYSADYKHSIDTIQDNIHNPNFETLILTSDNLTPIAFLYLQKKEDDYDKVWTVCTDPEYRGKGISSILLNCLFIKQLNDKRPEMLLEVFYDDIIHRGEKDIKQKQIMKHFSQHGFEPKTYDELTPHTVSNLLSNDNRTKVMTFNPQKWYANHSQNNRRDLNSQALQICGT